MEKKIPNTAEKIAIAVVLILANLRATIFVYLYPDPSVLLGPAWIEIMLWVLVGSGFSYQLFRDGFASEYFLAWRRNWLLAIFLLLAFLSVSWSVSPVVTLFRFLELFFAALVAAYFGLYFRVDRIMEILFWFGAGLFMLSIALALGAPPTGTMYWAPFYGAWRGVYWHRNHLASITALLSAVYLLRMFIAFQSRNSKGVLDGFFYIVSLVILYFARSATGYIVFLVLNFFVIVAWIWLKISHRLRRQHYMVILGAVVLLAILVLSNLDLIFGLFNRDMTMTGRLGLWSNLLGLASRRFWFGHGWGAVWTLSSFRDEIRHLVGWTSQPLIGDNGFVDILLHLGITGLLLFVGVLTAATVRSIRYALAQKTLPAFFPLVVVVYAFFANIPFSLFAETEVFVWFLIVAVLFMTTPSAARITR